MFSAVREQLLGNFAWSTWARASRLHQWFFGSYRITFPKVLELEGLGFIRPSLYVSNAWVSWEQPHLGTPLWTLKQLRPLERLFKSASLGQAVTWFSSNTNSPACCLHKRTTQRKGYVPSMWRVLWNTKIAPKFDPVSIPFQRTSVGSETLPEGTAPLGALGPCLCQPGHRDPYQQYERWLPSCVLMCQSILKIMVIPLFFRKFMESCGQLDPGSGLYLSSATPWRWQTGWRRGFIIFMKQD